MSGNIKPVFVDSIQGIPLNCLVPKTRWGTCVSRSHGTITIAEVVLGRLQVPGIAQKAD